MRLDKTTLRKVRADIDQALEEVAVKHGLTTLKVGRITFGPHQFTAKLEGACPNDKGEDRTPEELAWEREAVWHGLSPEWLGKVFLDHAGDSYRIKGLKPKSRKYPVLASDVVTGRTYQFPATTVVHAMRGKAIHP